MHFIKACWDDDRLRSVIDDTLSQYLPAGVPPTWVLGSHDDVRLVSRLGKATTWSQHFSDAADEIPDLDLGTRRAKAAALLMLALPGGAYIYQGDELGLPNVDDLPDEVLQDPFFRRSGGETRGRDGCRVPLPWTVGGPSYGFGTGSAHLPQPAWFGAVSVEAQETDPASTLNLYRAALALRRRLLGAETLEWVANRDPGVLHFRRPGGWQCITNFGREPVPMPAGTLAIASRPVHGRELPGDTTAWLVNTGA